MCSVHSVSHASTVSVRTLYYHSTSISRDQEEQVSRLPPHPSLPPLQYCSYYCYQWQTSTHDQHHLQHFTNNYGDGFMQSTQMLITTVHSLSLFPPPPGTLLSPSASSLHSEVKVITNSVSSHKLTTPANSDWTMVVVAEGETKQHHYTNT